MWSPPHIPNGTKPPSIEPSNSPPKEPAASAVASPEPSSAVEGSAAHVVRRSGLVEVERRSLTTDPGAAALGRFSAADRRAPISKAEMLGPVVLGRMSRPYNVHRPKVGGRDLMVYWINPRLTRRKRVSKSKTLAHVGVTAMRHICTSDGNCATQARPCSSPK